MICKVPSNPKHSMIRWWFNKIKPIYGHGLHPSVFSLEVC